MSSINATKTTDFELFLLFLGGTIDLLTNLVGVPLSVINLCLVARTSVIHPNMKSILIFQSFFILTRGSCRFVICLFKFILWDPISAETTSYFPALGLINLVGIYCRNFVPHILIIERVLATLMVRSYERHRGCLFTMLWSPFALFLSVYIAVTSSPASKPPLTSLITTAVQLVVGSVELAMFDGLCQYNSKIYQKMLPNEAAHNLSLRYQSVWREGRLRALYKGLGPNLVGVAPSKAVYFGCYSCMKRFLNEHPEWIQSNSHSVHMLSAGSADRYRKKTHFDAAREIIKES
uniref:G protein-coupled receptor n=1 Tax=Globodera pallida TaxID=36090 RepID=A0A183C0Q0_GLOPA